MNELFPFPAQVPFTDPKTGQLTREGMRIIKAVFVKLGGANGMSVDELAIGMHDDSGIEEIKLDQYRLRDELWTFPAQLQTQAPDTEDSGQVEALQAEVAELRKQIDAINQGPEL